MAGLVEWLEERGLAAHHAVLAENDVDLDVLSDLTDGDLRELGLSLGARKRLLRAVANPDRGAASAVQAGQRPETTDHPFGRWQGPALFARQAPGRREGLREGYGSPPFAPIWRDRQSLRQF